MWGYGFSVVRVFKFLSEVGNLEIYVKNKYFGV